MRKKGLIFRSLLLFSFVAALTIGLLITLPDQLQAYPEYSKDGTCVECHADQGGSGETSKPEEPTEPAEPDTVGPLDPYKPLPVEEAHSSVNNGMLGGGLGLAVLLIGGAVVMDKRKK